MLRFKGNLMDGLNVKQFASMAEWHKPRRRVWAKIISILISVTFVFPYLTWAFEAASFPRPTNLVMFNQQPIKIAHKLGTITQSFQGSDRLVVHVQDLHCNYEVQNNIARMIDVLAGEHGLELVGIEGASLPVNATILSTFPVEEVKKATAHYLVKQGKLTGAEMYAGIGQHRIRLEGIENAALYKRNRTTVMKFLNNESQGYIFDLRETLDELKRDIYNPALTALDKKKQAFREGDISLLKYSVHLYGFARQGRQDLSLYPNLRAYVSKRKAIFSDLVDSDGLFNELDVLDRRMRAGLYTSSDQEKLDLLSHRLDIMEKLVNISASPQDLAEYRAAPEGFQVRKFLDFIARHDELEEFILDAEVYKLDQYLGEVRNFYQVADERSRAFVANIMARMQKHQTKVSMLVTGGYHSDMVLNELKQKGVSYICIKPRLSRQDIINPYFALLRGRRTPLEKLLAQNQNILSNPIMLTTTNGNPNKVMSLTAFLALSPKERLQMNTIFALLKAGLLALLSLEKISPAKISAAYKLKIKDYAANQTEIVLRTLEKHKDNILVARFTSGISVLIHSIQGFKSNHTVAEIDVAGSLACVIPRHAEEPVVEALETSAPSRGASIFAGIQERLSRVAELALARISARWRFAPIAAMVILLAGAGWGSADSSQTPGQTDRDTGALEELISNLESMGFGTEKINEFVKNLDDAVIENQSGVIADIMKGNKQQTEITSDILITLLIIIYSGRRDGKKVVLEDKDVNRLGITKNEADRLLYEIVKSVKTQTGITLGIEFRRDIVNRDAYIVDERDNPDYEDSYVVGGVESKMKIYRSNVVDSASMILGVVAVAAVVAANLTGMINVDIDLSLLEAITGGEAVPVVVGSIGSKVSGMFNAIDAYLFREGSAVIARIKAVTSVYFSKLSGTMAAAGISIIILNPVFTLMAMMGMVMVESVSPEDKIQTLIAQGYLEKSEDGTLLPTKEMAKQALECFVPIDENNIITELTIDGNTYHIKLNRQTDGKLTVTGIAEVKAEKAEMIYGESKNAATEYLQPITEMKQMSKEDKLMLTFTQGDHGDVDKTGGKASSLSELYGKVPIPPGYATTVAMFHKIIEANPDLLKKHIKNTLMELDVKDDEARDEVAREIERRFKSGDLVVPAEVWQAFDWHYILLSWSEGVTATEENGLRCAVRSSGTAEDTAIILEWLGVTTGSEAGQGSTDLNVRGLRAMRRSAFNCMVGLFSSPGLNYRDTQVFITWADKLGEDAVSEIITLLKIRAQNEEKMKDEEYQKLISIFCVDKPRAPGTVRLEKALFDLGDSDVCNTEEKIKIVGYIKALRDTREDFVDPMKIGIGVVGMRMVNSYIAGTAFNVIPTTGFTAQAYIKSAFDKVESFEEFRKFSKDAKSFEKFENIFKQAGNLEEFKKIIKQAGREKEMFPHAMLLTIDAAFGLGESVVSNWTIPDREELFTLDGKNFTKIGGKIGSKENRVIYLDDAIKLFEGKFSQEQIESLAEIMMAEKLDYHALKEEFQLSQGEANRFKAMIQAVAAREDSDNVQKANEIYARLGISKPEFFDLANILVAINEEKFSVLVKTTANMAGKFCFENIDLRNKVATMLLEVCEDFGDLRDIEWAVELTPDGEPGRIIINKAHDIDGKEINVGGADQFNLQARPFTSPTDRDHPDEVRIANRVVDSKYIEDNNIKPIMEGTSVIGAAVGKVKWIDMSRPLAPQFAEVGKDTILMVEFATPDLDPGMERAAGVGSKQGGATSHAAIYCRENGIPVIVGIGEIPKHILDKYFKDGDIITIDGNNGRIYAGEIPLLDEDIRIEIKMLPKGLRGKTGQILASFARGEQTSMLSDYEFHFGNVLDRLEFAVQDMALYPPAAEARDNYYRELAGETLTLNKYQAAVLEILKDDHEEILAQRRGNPDFIGESVIERINRQMTGYDTAEEYVIETIRAEANRMGLTISAMQYNIRRFFDNKPNESVDLLTGAREIVEKLPKKLYPEYKGDPKHLTIGRMPLISQRGMSMLLNEFYKSSMNWLIKADLLSIKDGFDNNGMMFVFVRTPAEMRDYYENVENLIKEVGEESRPKAIAAMIETPSAVWYIDEILDILADYQKAHPETYVSISFGTNDLANLLGNTDRDSKLIQKLLMNPEIGEVVLANGAKIKRGKDGKVIISLADESSEILGKHIEHVVVKAIKKGIHTSLCGNLFVDAIEKILALKNIEKKIELLNKIIKLIAILETNGVDIKNYVGSLMLRYDATCFYRKINDTDKEKANQAALGTLLQQRQAEGIAAGEVVIIKNNEDIRQLDEREDGDYIAVITGKLSKSEDLNPNAEEIKGLEKKIKSLEEQAEAEETITIQEDLQGQIEGLKAEVEKLRAEIIDWHRLIYARAILISEELKDEDLGIIIQRPEIDFRIKAVLSGDMINTLTPGSKITLDYTNARVLAGDEFELEELQPELEEIKSPEMRTPPKELKVGGVIKGSAIQEKIGFHPLILEAYDNGELEEIISSKRQELEKKIVALTEDETSTRAIELREEMEREWEQEFVLVQTIKEMIQKGGFDTALEYFEAEYERYMREDLKSSSAKAGMAVVYETTSLAADEYAERLLGGRLIEIINENPEYGYMGASRNISDMYNIYRLELEVFKRLRQEDTGLALQITDFKGLLSEAVLNAHMQFLERLGLEPGKKGLNIGINISSEVDLDNMRTGAYAFQGINFVSINPDLPYSILAVDKNYAGEKIVEEKYIADIRKKTTKALRASAAAHDIAIVVYEDEEAAATQPDDKGDGQAIVQGRTDPDETKEQKRGSLAEDAGAESTIPALFGWVLKNGLVASAVEKYRDVRFWLGPRLELVTEASSVVVEGENVLSDRVKDVYVYRGLLGELYSKVLLVSNTFTKYSPKISSPLKKKIIGLITPAAIFIVMSNLSMVLQASAQTTAATPPGAESWIIPASMNVPLLAVGAVAAVVIIYYLWRIRKAQTAPAGTQVTEPVEPVAAPASQVEAALFQKKELTDLLRTLGGKLGNNMEEINEFLNALQTQKKIKEGYELIITEEYELTIASEVLLQLAVIYYKKVLAAKNAHEKAEKTGQTADVKAAARKFILEEEDIQKDIEKLGLSRELAEKLLTQIVEPNARDAGITPEVKNHTRYGGTSSRMNFTVRITNPQRNYEGVNTDDYERVKEGFPNMMVSLGLSVKGDTSRKVYAAQYAVLSALMKSMEIDPEKQVDVFELNSLADVLQIPHLIAKGNVIFSYNADFDLAGALLLASLNYPEMINEETGEMLREAKETPVTVVYASLAEVVRDSNKKLWLAVSGDEEMEATTISDSDIAVRSSGGPEDVGLLFSPQDVESLRATLKDMPTTKSFGAILDVFLAKRWIVPSPKIEIRELTLEEINKLTPALKDIAGIESSYFSKQSIGAILDVLEAHGYVVNSEIMELAGRPEASPKARDDMLDSTKAEARPMALLEWMTELKNGLITLLKRKTSGFVKSVSVSVLILSIFSLHASAQTIGPGTESGIIASVMGGMVGANLWLLIGVVVAAVAVMYYVWWKAQTAPAEAQATPVAPLPVAAHDSDVRPGLTTPGLVDDPNKPILKLIPKMFDRLPGLQQRLMFLQTISLGALLFGASQVKVTAQAVKESPIIGDMKRSHFPQFTADVVSDIKMKNVEIEPLTRKNAGSLAAYLKGLVLGTYMETERTEENAGECTVCIPSSVLARLIQGSPAPSDGLVAGARFVLAYRLMANMLWVQSRVYRGETIANTLGWRAHIKRALTTPTEPVEFVDVAKIQEKNAYQNRRGIAYVTATDVLSLYYACMKEAEVLTNSRFSSAREELLKMFTTLKTGGEAPDLNALLMALEKMTTADPVLSALRAVLNDAQGMPEKTQEILTAGVLESLIKTLAEPLPDKKLQSRAWRMVPGNQEVESVKVMGMPAAQADTMLLLIDRALEALRGNTAAVGTIQKILAVKAALTASKRVSVEKAADMVNPANARWDRVLISAIAEQAAEPTVAKLGEDLTFNMFGLAAGGREVELEQGFTIVQAHIAEIPSETTESSEIHAQVTAGKLAPGTRVWAFIKRLVVPHRVDDKVPVFSTRMLLAVADVMPAMLRTPMHKWAHRMNPVWYADRMMERLNSKLSGLDMAHEMIDVNADTASARAYRHLTSKMSPASETRLWKTWLRMARTRETGDEAKNTLNQVLVSECFRNMKSVATVAIAEAKVGWSKRYPNLSKTISRVFAPVAAFNGRCNMGALGFVTRSLRQGDFFGVMDDVLELFLRKWLRYSTSVAA